MMEERESQLKRLDTGEDGERVDYHETDLDFRKRLDSFVPTDLASRIKQVLSDRLKKQDDDDDSQKAVNM